MALDARNVLPRTAPADEVLREVLAALERGASVAVATVVSRQGSAPATPGQKLAVALGPEPDALVAIGTVGGGAIERVVLATLVEAAQDPTSQPRLETFRLGPSLGMCCGGSADVLVEPLRPAIPLVVVGAGHIGLATARLAAELGFRTLLVDAREAAADEARTAEVVARGVRVLSCDHDDTEVREALAVSPDRAFLLVVTHDHQLDQRVVEWGIEQGFAFVGGVGSRAKAERTRQRLAARGVAPHDVERVRMPVGVDVGARRPVEIAVAIAAELVAVRARGEGLARRDRVAPGLGAPSAAPTALPSAVPSPNPRRPGAGEPS